MNRSSIFIITHKEFNIQYPDNYIPIQVGKCNTNLNLQYLSDDTGINISKKNSNYCELTGMYWAWKNYELPDYVGLVHYRRFFKTGLLNHKILPEEKIIKYMKDVDIILPKKFYFPRKVWNNYFEAGCGKEKDLIALKRIIQNEYPEYFKSFEKIMNSYSASYCNMFITTKRKFDKYSGWLFEVLEKLESVTDISNYNKAEARIYGYISEILLNVWVDKNNLKIKYIEIIKTNNTFKKNVKWKIKMIKGWLIGNIKKVIHNLIFL